MRPVRKSSAHRLPRVSPQAQRSKPKFDVPQEAGLPPAATWVYRAQEAAAPAPAPVNPEALESSEPGSIMIRSFEVMASGVVAVAKANAMALRVMTAPFRLVSRLF
jgi:hypothetical protein